MPIFTTPLHEYNDCHEPAGSSTGGRFCAKTGTIVPLGPRQGLKREFAGAPQTPRGQALITRQRAKIAAAERRGDPIEARVRKRQLRRWVRWGVPLYVKGS